MYSYIRIHFTIFGLWLLWHPYNYFTFPRTLLSTTRRLIHSIKLPYSIFRVCPSSPICSSVLFVLHLRSIPTSAEFAITLSYTTTTLSVFVSSLRWMTELAIEPRVTHQAQGYTRKQRRNHIKVQLMRRAKKNSDSQTLCNYHKSLRDIRDLIQ